MTARGAIIRASSLHHRLAQRFFSQSAMPLWYWSTIHRTLKRWLNTEDPLFPPGELPTDRSTSLRSADLRQLLRDEILGGWTLDCLTLDALWRELLTQRPQRIIECGSGLSTVVMARYAELYARNSRPAVYSLEQNVAFKEETERRLSAQGLHDYVRVVYAPLHRHDEYDGDALRLSAPKAPADLLLIDGPSGRPGCRLWTLPLLAPMCRPGTRWLLDDAFRNGELWVLDVWSRLQGVTVEGIYPLSKGMAAGTITDPSCLTFAAIQAVLVDAERQRYMPTAKEVA